MTFAITAAKFNMARILFSKDRNNVSPKKKFKSYYTPVNDSDIHPYWDEDETKKGVSTTAEGDER